MPLRLEPPVFRLVVAVTLCAGHSLSAELPQMHATGVSQTVPGLGSTSFQTSTRSPQAQAAFLRGLLLLHIFEYSDAASSFVAAERLDPDFAMAYWGEAMTFNHAVWNQVNADGGNAALRKLAPTAAERTARIHDPREKAYVAAVEILYDGAGTKVERDHRYAQAMARLSAAYPADRNARLFYALALLGQSEGVRDVPVYLEAAQIAKAIYRLEPDNPGAAHYWIHGMDDPEHAADGLEAARALSKIAPQAAHAQHMCSHIFMALGMWDDVVAANVEAVRVDDLRDNAQGFPAYECGHYPSWLEYGYFQQGRLRAALDTVANCRRTDPQAAAWMAAHPGVTPFGAKSAVSLRHRLLDAYTGMEEMAMIEAPGRPGEAVRASQTLPPDGNPWSAFTRGYTAARSGDLGSARASLALLRSGLNARQAAPDADPQEVQALQAGTDSLSGLVAIREGHVADGLQELKHAVETYESMAFAFGPPVTLKPPAELEGEMLLEQHDAIAARKCFEQSLARAPMRTQSLLGLARAQAASGDNASARRTYATLLAIWHNADRDTPGLDEARKALAQTVAEVEPGR